MGFFDNEDDEGFGIEDFFRNFSNGGGFSEYHTIGPDGKKRTIRNSSRNLKGIPAKQVVTPKEVFFIFDFSGEKNVSAEVSDESFQYGEKYSDQKILSINSSRKNIGKFVLPKKIKLNTLNSTFNHGILEVRFLR